MGRKKINPCICIKCYDEQEATKSRIKDLSERMYVLLRNLEYSVSNKQLCPVCGEYIEHDKTCELNNILNEIEEAQ